MASERAYFSGIQLDLLLDVSTFLEIIDQWSRMRLTPILSVGLLLLLVTLAC